MIALIRAGERARTHGLILVSYAVKLGYGIFRLEDPEISTEQYYLPLSMREIGLGKYGTDSYMHPTQLPFSHPWFCMWKDESKRLVTHNRTGTVCRLRIKDDFYVSGEFVLETVDRPQEPQICTSIKWYQNQLNLHLETLKGKKINFEIYYQYFVFKDKSLNQILLSHISRLESVIIVSTIEWETLFPIPIKLIDLSYAYPTNEGKRRR